MPDTNEGKKIMGDKNFKDFRVTALLGAGVNMGLDLGIVPNTYNLTEKVVNAPYPIVDIVTNQQRNSDLLQYIYHTICENFSEGPLNPATSYGKVHFEILFHVLENLYSYKYFAENHGKNQKFPNAYVPPFAYFAKVDTPYTSSEIQQVMKQYITILMENVNLYNEAYKNNICDVNKHYKDFWALAPHKWDVFTLNYDTTIENSLSTYEDGYVEIDPKYVFKKFMPEQLLKSQNNTINHLHGCINYCAENMELEEYNKEYIYCYDSDDYVRWNVYADAMKFWKSFSRSNLLAQNHEVIFPSPIITGLNKTEKITSLPFNTYKQNLSLKIESNNALLIAGYSFGDLYLNREIERMRLYHGDNWRTVIIDYWDLGDDDMSERDKLKNYLWTHHPNQDLVHMILKVAQEPVLDGGIFLEKNKGQFVSKNGQLMLFVNGMQDALQYQNEIYAFLQS